MRVIVLVVVVTGGKQSQLLVLSLSLKFDKNTKNHFKTYLFISILFEGVLVLAS